MSIESKRIFTAIFPRISMFNHSCKPNIRNRFNKTDLMIYARRTVNVGDEILNCYGPNNKLDPYEERQEMLKQQYHFQCDCSACLRPDDDYVSQFTRFGSKSQRKTVSAHHTHVFVPLWSRYGNFRQRKILVERLYERQSTKGC